MRKDAYVQAITLLATITFTFFIVGSFKILNANIMFEGGFSSFAYMLILTGLEPQKKQLYHYVYFVIGAIILLFLSFIIICEFLVLINI